MTTVQKRWTFTLLLFGLLALVAWQKPTPMAELSHQQMGALKVATFAEGMPPGRGMFIAEQADLTMTAADINQLIRDFPTAAGAIHAQVLAQQQYLAASEGHYDQAMRLMAKSFLSADGSGSYASDW